MSEPLVVIIPHRLGKDEALRRIKDGLTRARAEFARLITLEEERWEGDRLSFKVRSLGQRAFGSIDVYEAGARHAHLRGVHRRAACCGCHAPPIAYPISRA